MANQEHVDRLSQGVEHWNQWREEYPNIKPALSDSNLFGADLTGADLSHANLFSANLENADLSNAVFERANLISANLEGANLRSAFLSRADLRGAVFSRARLSFAYLSSALLSNANFTRADLSHADLWSAQALGTNFTGATLTGACIKDWNINTDTRLYDVVCDYIYLQENRQERRPNGRKRTFAPGEFTKLFQKVREKVDLIFHNGVDWQSLLVSLGRLKVEAEGVEPSIQSIENKDDGAFVVRVNVPPGMNAAEVEQSLMREYDLALKVIDELYLYQLQAKDDQVVIYRQQNTDLMVIARLMASRPIIEGWQKPKQ